MNQPQVRPQPPREEPEIDPAEVLRLSVDLLKSRLSTAKSIAQDVFGEAVSEETVISVYDRLNDQITDLLGEEDAGEE